MSVTTVDSVECEVRGRRSPESGYRPELDGLRALAVAAVIVYHFHEPLVPGGYLGVTGFFALSGYLITHLLVSEYERAGRVDLYAFLARRALRLYPALVLCVVLSTSLAAITGSSATPRGNLLVGSIGALLFLNDVLLGAYSAFDGWLDPTWSLGVEEQFYLVWPLLLLWVTRGISRAAVSRVCVAGALVMAGVSALSRARLGWAPTYFTPLGNTTPLLLGCALALVPRVPPWVRYLRVPAALTLAALMLLAPASSSPIAFYGPEQFAALAVIGLLAGLRVSPPPPMLCRRALVWVGRRSYGLYLFHEPVRFALISEFPSSAPVVRSAVGVPMALILAACSYEFVERPFLRRKSALAQATA